VLAKLWVELPLRGCRELSGFGETALPSAILQLPLYIKDNYPKYVHSMDDNIWGNDYKGIKRLNIIDFLLG
jgi:hypothetical protein